MQFLAYIVVLAVSVSTILLELHWLTSPAPQPKPTIQASTAPPARAKVEGPNVELSPVYPKPEAPRSVGSVTGSPPAETQASMAEVQSAPGESGKGAETTGSATPSDTPSVSAVSAATSTSQSSPAVAPAPARAANVATKNRCDVASCASAYSSFRASDCTFQPFEGARQLCVKPPVAEQKVAAKTREPNGDEAREQSKKAELQRAVQFLRGRRPSDEGTPSQATDEPGGMVFFGRPGWR